MGDEGGWAGLGQWRWEEKGVSQQALLGDLLCVGTADTEIVKAEALLQEMGGK